MNADQDSFFICDPRSSAFICGSQLCAFSANVYDSLAEAYERGGRLDLAEPLYDKARVLGQQNNDPNLALYKANYDRVHAKLKNKQ